MTRNDDLCRALTDYLRERAGDSFRGVAAFDGEEVTDTYLRDDVREIRLEEEVVAVVARVRRETAPAESDALPFGSLHATVRMLDDAILVHFPLEPGRGVVVSFDPTVAPRLSAFVEDCAARIRSARG